MKKRNCFIGQSGGPTTAINASLAGIIAKCIETQEFEHVYGMINGIKGLIEHKYMDLLDIFKTEENINHLKHSPAMYLGSCRYKLPTRRSTKLWIIIPYFWRIRNHWLLLYWGKWFYGYCC